MLLNLLQLMLICLWYLPDLELIFCKLTPNAVWNNPLNAGLSWALYIKHHEVHKRTQGICKAVGCSRIFAVPWRRKRGAELRGPGAALGQLLWLSPLKRTWYQGCVPAPMVTREKRRLWCLLTKWCSSTLQTSHLQQHMIKRKNKWFRLWDFQITRSMLNSTNYQLEASSDNWFEKSETGNFISSDGENIFKGVASASAHLIITVSVVTLYWKLYFFH